jgi:cytochrome c556
MTRLGHFVITCTFVVATTTSTAVRADDQDVIDYREHIMKTMGEQVAAISQILQQKAPADNLAVHVQILAVTATTAKKAFEPKVPGGEAKPDVWTHWSDFAKRLDDLTGATADLAKTAKTSGTAAVAPKVQAALTCKSCHDTYRVEKKKK